MKKIGIITYNKPHLKTQQVLNNILYKYDLYLIISPFKKFKKKNLFLNIGHTSLLAKVLKV